MNLQQAQAITILTRYGAFAGGRPVVPGTIGSPCATGRALLTEPSKMPSYSWSLPAGNVHSRPDDKGTCPGAVFGPMAICDGCYANPDSLKVNTAGELKRRGGNYDRPAVREAQIARRDWTVRCLMTKEGRDEWLTVITAAVTWATRGVSARHIPYFRVHDSGDMFSPRYAELWRDVCAAVPDVRFWIPTRSYRLPRILTVLQDVAALPNAAVRPSALYVGDEAPRVDGLSAGTGVKVDGYNCPASSQDNACGSCRACWSTAATAAVYYHAH